MRAGLAHADRRFAKRSLIPENIAGGLAGDKNLEEKVELD
jgi:hypothetical protein